MGSDTDDTESGESHFVSIHAPAWGATVVGVTGLSMATVSIHAPAWGATATPRRVASRLRGFNSRSRMGSDGVATRGISRTECFNSRSRMGSDFIELRPGSNDLVSIHAPAWGATNQTAQIVPFPKFQFTLPHGERPARPRRNQTPSRFQFTLPHGERPNRHLALEAKV